MDRACKYDSVCSRAICFLTFYPGFTQDHLPKLGTTSFLASIVFTTAQRRDEVTARLVERIGKVGHGAVVEGIHAEVNSTGLPLAKHAGKSESKPELGYHPVVCLK